MNEGVKDLLREATRAAPGTVVLEGRSGLVAELQESVNGPARLIRILEGDREVFWTFQLHPGEARPQFYPEDLPFLAGHLIFAASWGESGLSASWANMPGADLEKFNAEVRPMVEKLAELPGVSQVAELLKKPGKGRAAEILEQVQTLIPSSFLDTYSEAARRHFGSEVPPELLTRVDEISAFHEAAGWSQIDGEEPKWPSFTRRFQKGEKQRELSIQSFLWMSSIMLKERDLVVMEE
jgi:hypothetical protein